jgi:toxin-antitoxin system PIN domain toxin
MRSCDVNVLVYAHNADEPRHAEYSAWLADALDGPEPFGVSSLVLSGFVRIVTHPRIFVKPYSPTAAIEAASVLRSASAVVALEPGRSHWSIFARLCRTVNAKGNTVPDAYLAALAIEHGCEWNTTDQGFARFPGLRWRHPLSR